MLRPDILFLDSTVPIKPAPIALLRGRDTPHPERGTRRGDLIRIRHGVYAAAAPWAALSAWERYLARVHAAALRYPDAVFCLESAAALQGAPVFGDPVLVHVLVPSAGTARQYAGLRIHRSQPERAIILAGGLSMTSAADTAVDLARHRHHVIGLAVADAALRGDTTLSADDLLRINESRASSRGRKLARWPLGRATAKAESALESVSRAVVEWLGLVPPELQVSFRSPAGETDRSDFFWPELGVAGEADGDLKYDGRFGDPRTVLRRQAERDRRLRAHVREVAHWGWLDVARVAPLRDILRSTGVRAIAPEESAQLHSLARLLRPRRAHPTADPPSAR